MASDVVRFVITDSGIGLSEDEIARLFIPFSQADVSSTRRFGGTGLGLAISQRLVRLMGGEGIDIVSRPQKGSRFSFDVRLPSCAEPRMESAPGDRAVPDFSGRRILLVEDNELNQVVAMDHLSLTGAEVVIAGDGEQALRRLEGEAGRGTPGFDVVLMDVQMPVMDGVTATRQIRARPEFEELAIIAMTAHALQEEELRCRDAGMNDFLTKPISAERLYAHLQRWLGKSDTPDLASSPATPVPALFSPPGLESLEAAGFDTALALKYAGQHSERFLKTLRVFLQTHSEDGGKMQIAMGEEKLDVIATLGHRYKGAAPFTGATRLARLGADFEAQSRENPPPEQWMPLAQELKTESERTISVIRDYLGLVDESLRAQ